MSQIHAIVWLDHREAKVLSFSADESHTMVVHSEQPERQLHRKSGRPGSGHAPDDHVFFDAIVEAIGDSREVLIAGPGTAKTSFERYVHEHFRDLSRRVVGVETLDHPSDGQLLGHARKYFKRVDQLGST